MDRDPRAYLWEAKQSADAIAEILAGRTFADYQADRILRWAVERQFQIAGEALRQLQKSAPDLAQQISSLAEAIAFRNVLVHGYAIVEDQIVWRTVQESLPALRDELTKLLAKVGSG